jgi:hypothetical protein
LYVSSHRAKQNFCSHLCIICNRETDRTKFEQSQKKLQRNEINFIQHRTHTANGQAITDTCTTHKTRAITRLNYAKLYQAKDSTRGNTYRGMKSIEINIQYFIFLTTLSFKVLNQNFNKKHISITRLRTKRHCDL